MELYFRNYRIDVDGYESVSHEPHRVNVTTFREMVEVVRDTWKRHVRTHGSREEAPVVTIHAEMVHFLEIDQGKHGLYVTYHQTTVRKREAVTSCHGIGDGCEDIQVYGPNEEIHVHPTAPDKSAYVLVNLDLSKFEGTRRLNRIIRERFDLVLRELTRNCD